MFAQLVHAITVSAHKIGGPKSCGTMYLNPRLNVPSLTPGVTHERGLRGGTMDIPAVVAFAVTLEQYVYDALRGIFECKLPTYYRIVQWAEQLPTIYSLFREHYGGQYVY